MPAPTNLDEFLDVVRKSELIDTAKLNAFLASQQTDFASPSALAKSLLANGFITQFHADQLIRGKYRGFFLGKYKILDRIGLGGMGQVFLGEHSALKRRIAIKVLPPDRAENKFSRERFTREARAAAQLDHPNIVRAFDFDADGDVMFLVMEYVEGVTLHDLVQKVGPIEQNRAVHFLIQSASGLAYLKQHNMIHRDIKPANILVDRLGVIKILDLGLVRSSAGNDQENLTQGEGVKMLGTADYLAPEQAIDCSNVDTRADIYSLGATAYYILTGKPPFEADKVSQKLLMHQVKPVTPVHKVVLGLTEEFSAIITKMLAKKPEDRYQTPQDLIAALEPFLEAPPAPPSEDELPTVAGLGQSGSVVLGSVRSAVAKDMNASGSLSSSTSGSAIRYHYDSKLAEDVRAQVLKVLTPANQMPALPSETQQKSGQFIPPPIAASATHGKKEAHQAPAAPKGIELPDYLRTSNKPAAVNAPSPSSMVQAAPKRSMLTTIGLVLAFAVMLAVGVYITLNFGVARSDAATQKQ
ncbi:MAG: serine/threonine protein kinase [Fimbriiglobus sp.]